MPEYSRILIEEYCIDHPNTRKADFLSVMVRMSYDIYCEVSEKQMVQLEKYISTERDSELKAALIDLDEFMNGYM